MKTYEIKSIELSEYPGMSRGYVVVTRAVYNDHTGENKFEETLVPAIEVGKRFYYDSNVVVDNGPVTEEIFFLDGIITCSRILGKREDFLRLWHAPERFDKKQVIVLDR